MASLPIVLANCVTDDLQVASYIPNDFQGQADVTCLLLEKGYKSRFVYIFRIMRLQRKSDKRAFKQSGFHKKCKCTDRIFMNESDDYLEGADRLKDIWHQIPNILTMM
ncbi:periplasmic binding protein/LacI transcriptional regulator [Actinobacillus equuli]|nr:periplasmic binding protein/LacI transcriptional regulator [Actinobacillus equuli]